MGDSEKVGGLEDDEMEVAVTTVQGQCVYCPNNPSCLMVSYYYENQSICVSSWQGFNEGDYIQFSFTIVKKYSCCQSGIQNTATGYDWQAWTPPDTNGAHK